jgi:glycosyltransferase involved in cell wall biosynthesis
MSGSSFTDAMNENVGNFCLVCGSKKIHYDFSVGKFRIEECVDCKLMRLNPQPTDQELADIYSKNYFINFDDNRSHITALKSGTADHYLNLIESYTKKPLQGRLLEIGCGQGDFLVKAAARGLDVTGVEYSSHAVEIAANKLGKSGQVICGEITQLLNSNLRFDYIVFADVLEHVRNPRKFLQSVHSLLGKEGIAIAIVPSLDSFSARLMKNKWVEFKPEHLWYFSKATLKRLFYSEGFYKEKIYSAKKTLSIDYIAEHFEHYPVQPFSNLMRLMKRLLPHFLRRYPFRVVASGIMLLARKNEIKFPQKLSVVMAAFNEEKTIQKIIEGILAKKINNIEIELIIVESHSTDGTQEIVRQYEGHDRVKIIWQDKALGKGNAVRAGLAHISGEFVLIQDADDEYDLEDYDALIEPLIRGEAAFVLGARHGGNAWKMRKFDNQRLLGHLLNMGHWGFTLLVNIFFRLRLSDPFTMYKVFRADCLDGLTFNCNRFDFDYELLIKLVKNGYHPIEIPVNYRSRSFKEGKKVRIFRDPWTWLKAIVRLRLQKD